MDICCLKRPFDDQTQLRIRLESEAVLWVLNAAKRNRADLSIAVVSPLDLIRSDSDE